MLNAQALPRRIDELLVSGRYEPPVLPEVAQAVLRETSKASCEPRRLADILKRDAAMAAGVLRMANSPAYAPVSPIVSLSQAISRLGLEAIRRMAVAVACESRLFRVRGREAEARALYFRSTVGAFVAQELARHLRLNVEDAFLGGLLHDLGEIILLGLVADLEATGSAAPIDAVRAVLSERHAAVGAAAVEHWALIPRVAVAIRHHHETEGATDTASASLLFISDHVVAAFLDARPLDAQALAPALGRLNLYFDDLEAVAARRDELLGWARGLE